MGPGAISLQLAGCEMNQIGLACQIQKKKKDKGNECQLSNFHLTLPVLYGRPRLLIVGGGPCTCRGNDWVMWNDNGWPGPNFIELLSTQICLAWSFFLDKNRITTQIANCCTLLVTGIQTVVCLSWISRGSLAGNPVFIKVKISGLKQIFVLSSSMKLGPDLFFLWCGSMITPSFHGYCDVSVKTLQNHPVHADEWVSCFTRKCHCYVIYRYFTSWSTPTMYLYGH